MFCLVNNITAALISSLIFITPVTAIAPQPVHVGKIRPDPEQKDYWGCVEMLSAMSALISIGKVAQKNYKNCVGYTDCKGKFYSWKLLGLEYLRVKQNYNKSCKKV